MNRETQNLLLLLIGGAVLWTALDGSYLRYVKPGLFPFLLISGAGFLLLGIIAIVRDIRRARPPHNHEHGTGRTQWLLLAPVAALLLIGPPALGAAAVTTSAPMPVAANQPQQHPFPPLPEDPAPTLTMYELVERAVLDSTHSLDGREVRISGFVIAPGDSTIELARVLITCCVADARYLYVHLDGIHDPIADNTWLEVRGTVEPGSAAHDPSRIPAFKVTEYHRIPAPAGTYELPH